MVDTKRDSDRCFSDNWTINLDIFAAFLLLPLHTAEGNYCF